MENEKIIVTITPTYSGCPAMKAIEHDILSILKENGIDAVIKTVYAPAWTTDWISEEAKMKLNAYGIAPPMKRQDMRNIKCPRCNSSNSELISHFGSTACKSLYRCKDCKEPFDYFKCH
jgi:ring-1,2-phenylacetyl-CoA epoxidase subunit PaaD